MNEEKFRVGVCSCCGQIRTLHAPTDTAEEAAAMATLECDCPGGKAAKAKAEERQTVREIFPDLEDDLHELICRIADLIRADRLCSGSSLKQAENVAVKFKLKGAAIIITREEKRKHQRSI